ncbi:MAG: hypothetical protein P9X24_14230 [Candidatus Hatepunaea meridiana]|nr:hypothetical protein [Candidatus Hatepunaea meridiana]
MNIYIMKNFTLKEVYFGLADGDTHKVTKSHKDNPLSPVGHWKFDEEEIKWGEVNTGLPEEYARSFLRALRNEPPDDDWIMVYGMD